MQQFRVVSRDPEPDGWGTRTDVIEATPQTWVAKFNALGRWAQRNEIVSVEEIKAFRANPHKKCACGNRIEKERQRAQHDLVERRKNKGKEKPKIGDIDFVELLEALDQCSACKPLDLERNDERLERVSRLLKPLVAQDPTTARIVRGRPRKQKPLSETPIKAKPIPGVSVPVSSNLGHLRPRLKTSGQALQNPWDRAPRDRGRRDFEAPTETKAMNKRQRELDNAPDIEEVVNRQAAGSV